MKKTRYYFDKTDWDKNLNLLAIVRKIEVEDNQHFITINGYKTPLFNSPEDTVPMKTIVVKDHV